MDIDTSAPVFSRKEIIIHAPVEKVWQIQTGIESWVNWQPDVSSAQLEGSLATGTVFRWKAKGLAITSTLHTVEPQQRIGWTGVSLGMYAIHNWTFERQGEKNTHVVTEESLSGWLTRLMKLLDPLFLEKSLEASLQILKATAERE